MKKKMNFSEKFIKFVKMKKIIEKALIFGPVTHGKIIEF